MEVSLRFYFISLYINVNIPFIYLFLIQTEVAEQGWRGEQGKVCQCAIGTSGDGDTAGRPNIKEEQGW